MFSRCFVGESVHSTTVLCKRDPTGIDIIRTNGETPIDRNQTDARDFVVSLSLSPMTMLFYARCTFLARLYLARRDARAIPRIPTLLIFFLRQLSPSRSWKVTSLWDELRRNTWKDKSIDNPLDGTWRHFFLARVASVSHNV